MIDQRAYYFSVFTWCVWKRQGRSGYPVIRLAVEYLLTFLNSDAQLRIVVEIGGGSVACGAKTGLFSEIEVSSCKKNIEPSVREGIQGSTEYGKLSIKAQMPRMAEWSILKDSA